MDNEQLNKMVQETYNDSKEDSLRAMIGEFYNRKMLSSIILVWIDAIIIIGLAIFSAVRFFRAQEVKYQLMYAVIFIGCVQFVTLMKIFAWQMIHRNSIKRELKRLEIRIAQLNQTVQGMANQG